MPSEQRLAFQARAARDPRLTALTFEARVEPLFERASGVVAMGGYNTFCEILSFGKPALLVPRTTPRLEQYLRAERAQCWAWCGCSPNDGVRAPQQMAAALRALPAMPVPRESVRAPMLEGLDRISSLIAPWLGPRWRGARAAPQPLRVAAVRQPHRHPGQGLSAPVRDLHRPGDPGPGAARPGPRDRLPAPSDRPAGTRAAPGRSGRRSATCRSICRRSRCGCCARSGWHCRSRRFWRAAARSGCADLRRDPTANRGRRFGQALVLAAELPARRRLAARALPAHAGLGRPLRRHPARPAVQLLGARQGRLDHPGLGEAREAGGGAMAGHLQPDEPRPSAGAGAGGRPRAGLSRPGCGAVSRTPRAQPGATAAIRRAGAIVCVARAVEKKGLDILLEALARLPADLDWRFEHVGGGPLATDACGARPSGWASAGRVDLAGCRARRRRCWRPCARADLFCLAARVAADGDRDGLPNVIMEAMSQELPVVATEVGAIPEIVVRRRHRPAGASRTIPRRLAAALEALIRSPRCGRPWAARAAGGSWSSSRSSAGIARLAARFGIVAGRREAA